MVITKLFFSGYICVCSCVRVCVWRSERQFVIERKEGKRDERERMKERGRERERPIYSDQGLDFLETWNYTKLMTQ